MKQRWQQWIIVGGYLLGVILLLDLAPFLRGNEEWHWWQAPMPAFSRLLIFTLATLAIGAYWYYIDKKQPISFLLPLTGLFALVTIWQFTLLAQFRANPLALQYEYVVSNQVSGYWSAAQELGDVQTALRDFPVRMPAFTADPHPRSKPPGIVLMYWGVEQMLGKMPAFSNPVGHWARGVRCGDVFLARHPTVALATAVVMGVLIPLLSALIIVPAFFLGKQFGDTRTGWLAAGLVAILPGRLLFTPNMDTVYPMLALLAIWLVNIGINRHQLRWTFFSGVVLSLLTFFSIVNALVGLIIGFYLLLTYVDWTRIGGMDAAKTNDKNPHLPSSSASQLFGHLTALALGSVSIWIIYWAGYGVTPFDIFEAAAPARNDLRRDYMLWLGWNLVDFALFAGVPLVLLTIIFRKSEGRSAKDEVKLFSHFALRNLAIAFWLTLIGFNATGQIRAEVGRIWLVIAGIPALLAATQIQSERWRQLLFGCLLLTTFAMGWRWEVNPLEWPPPERPPVLANLPEGIMPASIPFGDDIVLAGYDMQTNDSELEVTLYWQANGQPQVPYTVFVHVLDNAGNIQTQQDTMPRQNSFPTTCWRDGMRIADTYTLPLTTPLSSTDEIRIGLYDQATGDLLSEPFFLMLSP